MARSGISRKRRMVWICTILAIGAIISVIMTGLYAQGDVKISLTEDYQLKSEDSVIIFDGYLEIGNPYLWTMSNINVTLSLDDNSNGKSHTFWDAPGINIPSRSTVKVPVHAQIPLTNLCSSVINSIKCDESLLSIDANISGTVLYSLLDISADSEICFPLAEKGSSVTYDSVTNNSSTYCIRVSNLKEVHIPPDFDACFQSEHGLVYMSSRSLEGTWYMQIESTGNLDQNIDSIYEEETSITGLPDGFSSKAAVSLLYAMSYARWFI